MNVIPLRREPAYTPMGPPGRCMTPGHEDRVARLYPGGWLCDWCIRASRQAFREVTGDAPDRECRMTPDRDREDRSCTTT